MAKVIIKDFGTTATIHTPRGLISPSCYTTRPDTSNHMRLPRHNKRRTSDNSKNISINNNNHNKSNIISPQRRHPLLHLSIATALSNLSDNNVSNNRSATPDRWMHWTQVSPSPELYPGTECPSTATRTSLQTWTQSGRSLTMWDPTARRSPTATILRLSLHRATTNRVTPCLMFSHPPSQEGSARSNIVDGKNLQRKLLPLRFRDSSPCRDRRHSRRRRRRVDLDGFLCQGRASGQALLLISAKRVYRR